MLKPANRENPETYKTRKGKVNGYLEYLTSEEVQWLDARLDENLSDFFGYGAAALDPARIEKP